MQNMKNRLTELWRKSSRSIPALGPPLSLFIPYSITPSADRKFIDSFYPLNSFGETSELFFGDAKRQTALQAWCSKFFNAAQDKSHYYEELDKVLSDLLQVEIRTSEAEELVVGKALALLARAPAAPPPFEGAHRFWQNHQSQLLEYYPDIDGKMLATSFWESMSVVTRPSTNTLLTILNFCCKDGYFWDLPDGKVPMRIWKESGYARSEDPRLEVNNGSQWWTLEHLVNYTNLLAEIVETANRLCQSKKISVNQEETCWMIARSFLWASWHRSVLLVQWFAMEKQVEWGFHFDRIDRCLRGTGMERDWRIIDAEKTDYICNWAYGLLKTDKMVGSLDLRSFYQRYNELYRNRPARCLSGERTCIEKAPKHCNRFVGAAIRNQSAHRASCGGQCPKLRWNEDSYRSVTGARAVSIFNTTEKELFYCEASENTLSISHVWSHGQGGRPETDGSGFNRCLHERYVAIARKNGCTSYWMDTPCIPSDHELREEAIANINSVFLNSKITLVCDIDLLSIDVTDLSLARKESILTAILVCDWNVRAWTFLESLRGRSHIHILFGNDQTMSMFSIICDVVKEGRIDIGVLYLTAVHLLPPPRDDDYIYPAKLYTDWLNQGFLNVENAASQLSHRQASRPGDDVVIWSLLVGHDAHHNAEIFWLSRRNDIHALVLTGFLFSSAPRIEGRRGLHWAPSQPTCDRDDEIIFLAGDGSNTKTASITDEGLEGDFAMHTFSGNTLCRSFKYKMQLTQRFRKSDDTPYEWIALLQPLFFNDLNRPTALRYRGNNSGHPLFGVCVSHDQTEWVWKGVHEWDDSPLPSFEKRTILLV